MMIFDEVNEIKALYDKAQEEMRAEFEKENEDPGEGYLQKLEERLLQGDKQELMKEASDETEVIDG